MARLYSTTAFLFCPYLLTVIEGSFIDEKTLICYTSRMSSVPCGIGKIVEKEGLTCHFGL